MQIWCERICKSDTLESLQAIMIEIAKELSYEIILYNIQIANSFEESRFIALGNFPKAWVEQYQKQNYATIDPVLKHCITNETPIYWQDAHDENNPLIKDFFEDATSFYLIDGVSQGLRKSSSEVGMITLASKDFKPKSDKTINAIQLVQPYIHEQVIRLSEEYKEFKKTLLTKRELECLHHMVQGETSIQIAKALFISESTAVFHIKNIIEKLDAKNRTQAVARAVLIGLVNPLDYHASQSHTFYWKDI